MARIIDATGDTVTERDEPLAEPSPVSAGRFVADYRLELPLTQLGPGEYLLTVDVTAGDNSERRTCRFIVVP